MNWLVRQQKMRPGARAVRTPEVALTWAELGQRVMRTAAALDVAGLRREARVAVLAENTVQYVALTLAAMWTGTTLVPLNARLPDAQLSRQLARSGASLLVIDHSAAQRKLELGDVRFVQLEELTFSRELEPVSFDLDSLATLMFTSGTTGEPRLCGLTWRNHEASALASAVNLGVQPDDDWLCCLPLYHVGGLAVLLRTLVYGTSMTLLEGFDEETVLGFLERDVTMVSLVPTMLQRLARQAGSIEELAARLRGGRLRAILLGGGPADPEFVWSCLQAGLPVIQTYGMTETSSQIATMPPARAQEKVGASGYALHGAEIAVRDGVICVRGPMVMSGYVDAPEVNATHFVEGWYVTGDAGEIDGDGFLWVHGRHDEVIVTGGENVAPQAVEQIIARHPAVEDVAVFGAPDHDWGNRVVAAVVAPSLGPEDLDGWCREHLAGPQRPKEWRFMSALPRTASGKVHRAALLQQ